MVTVFSISTKVYSMDSLKKRNRIPSSCSVCRKRKSRCDRVKPVCGSCKQKSIAHLCIYENEKPGRFDDDPYTHMAQMSQHPIPQLGPQMISPIQQIPHAIPQLIQQIHLLPQHMQLSPHQSPQGHPHLSPGQPAPIIMQQIPPAVHGISPGMSQASPLSNGSYTVHGIPYYPSSEDSNGHYYDPRQRSFLQSSAYGPPSQTVSPATSQVSSRQQIINYRERSRSIVPPHSGPPAPTNIPMPNQTPRYYDLLQNTPAASTPINDNANSVEPVQLPPLKNVNPTPTPDIGSVESHKTMETHLADANVADNFVLVPIGPSSSLRINPNDDISALFDNASTPLTLEGPYIQSHGYSTYVGLSKADKYVKYLRDFAVHLLQSGVPELEQPKKRKRSPASTQSPAPSSEVLIISNSVKSEMAFHSLATPLSLDHGDNDKGEGNRLSNANVIKLEESGNPEATTKQANGDEESEDDEEEEGDNEDRVNDGEDMMLITRVNMSKEQKPHDPKRSKFSVIPGLKTLFLGTHDSRKEYYAIVKRAVLEILPSKRNLYFLYKRYWAWVHLFIPILNEQSVLMDINQILDGFESTLVERYTTLSIKSDKHLLNIAILLLVTRLGYMSLVHNQSIHNQYDDDEMLALNESKDVPFSLFDDVVNLCLTDEHTSHRSSVRHVQTLCLIHYYREVSPNNCLGLGAADSQILFGTIVTHAMSMGLNRDPSKFVEHETINNNKNLAEVWRNLWFYISNQDAHQSIHRLCALNIYNGNMSDNKMPSSYNNEDLTNLQLTINEVSKHYRKLSLIINNFVDKPKVIDILGETNKLEHIFFNYFGKDFFSNFICTPAVPQNFKSGTPEHISSYLKVAKYLLFMQLRCDLSTIYYEIAMNYESNSSKFSNESMNSGVELFKIHFKSIVQLVYIMSYVFDNSVELFGRNYDYILTAHMEKFSIKTHSFLTSFFIRLIAQKQVLTLKQVTEPEYAAPDRLHAVDGLFRIILAEAGLFVGNFRALSLRYVNSYKIYILTYYVLKQCMENPEIFFQYAINDPSIFEQGTSMLDYFSVAEINYLTKLCEEFRVIKDIQDEHRKANTEMINTSKPPSSMGSPDLVHTTSSLPPGKPVHEVKTSSKQSKSAGAKDFGDRLFKFPSNLTFIFTDANVVSSVSNNMEYATTENNNVGTDASISGEENIFALMLNNLQSLNNMTGMNDVDIKGDDFLKYIELYGDGGNNIILE